MKRVLPLLAVLVVLGGMGGVSGCTDDSDGGAGQGIEDVWEDVSSDAEAGDDVEKPPRPQAGERVAYDLEPFLEGGSGNGGNVRLYRVEDAGDLIGGDAAEGRVGDFMFENDTARFLVQSDQRTMSPCPWGGNVIDVEYLGAGGGGDTLDEICLFLNADQTFKPERYEILHDGSKGHAVLAVTGHTELLDFLNLTSMIAQMAPGLAKLFKLKPDGLMPLTMTIYYILGADDAGLRVVTAMRNDGDEQLDVVASHLIVSGGAGGGYFNPLSSMGGFGYGSVAITDPKADLLPYLAYRGEESSFAYVPKPAEHLRADLPIGGAYFTISGVAASILGRTDLVQLLLSSPKKLRELEGVYHLMPGDVDAVEHRVFAGDGVLSTMLDGIYSVQGVVTGTVSGIVEDGAGQPLAGARVSAIDSKNRTMNQTVSGVDGRYRMLVPVGEYTVSARLTGRPTHVRPVVSVVAGQSADVPAIVLVEAARMEVSVRTPEGKPTPARVSVLCEGACPNKPTSQEEEVTDHKLPADFALVEWVGVSGEHGFDLPAGTYRVVVSRGMEWSVWPQDALVSGGKLVTIAEGETLNLDVEIARVLDTGGALSGDFHVHAMASADSAVSNRDRMLTFMVEGVDVVVSSDHDVISDYGPAILELGAGHEIATIVGTEITTSDLGHFNGFPVTADPAKLRQGALDWGNGAQPALVPADLFSWLREHPGEQVVQINHPDSSYLIQSDVLRSLTYGNPVQMRVQAVADPQTGETGMWSDDFTAMELMNGNGQGRFWGVSRWWFTMLGRGHRVTGTAVSDTHNLYGNTMGGVPRTFVFVPEGTDSAATFDETTFVLALNEGRALGTNGPFFKVLVTNSAAESARIGDTLATNGQPVDVEVLIQVPEWMAVDHLDLFMNVDAEQVVRGPGKYDTTVIEPTRSWAIELTPADLVEVASGQLVHRRYQKTVTMQFETDVDAYMVFVVRGAAGRTMFPVLPTRGALPIAFSNPVYLDADGGGYDKPHLAELAKTPPPVVAPMQAESTSNQYEDLEGEVVITPELAGQLLHEFQGCLAH